MKIKLLWLLLFSLLGSPGWAKPVSLYDGQLTVEVPALFQSASTEVIATMFGQAATKPQAVFLTVDSETRISFTLLQSPLTVEQLAATKDVLIEQLESQMPLKLLTDEMMDLHGQPWFHLDYEIQSEPEAKHDTILGTSLNGRLLFVAVSSPENGYELIKDDLASLIQSLTVVNPRSREAAL